MLSAYSVHFLFLCVLFPVLVPVFTSYLPQSYFVSTPCIDGNLLTKLSIVVGDKGKNIRDWLVVEQSRRSHATLPGTNVACDLSRLPKHTSVVECSCYILTSILDSVILSETTENMVLCHKYTSHLHQTNTIMFTIKWMLHFSTTVANGGS